jgi:sugar phosphate isomerase/epimerase
MEISLSPIMMEGSDKRGLMDFEQFTRLASDIGYHGICMRASLAGVQTPRAERLERKRELDRLGLRPTMVTANFDVPLNNDNGPKALRDIGPHLDVADDFDCKLLRVCIKSWADFKWVQRAADEALERGITLTHMAHGQSMFETVDGSIEYVRRVNRRSFALTYETTNWVWCLQDVGRETIKRISPYLCYVYLKNTKMWEKGKKRMLRWYPGWVDYDDAPIGEPDTIDFQEILEALVEIGYDDVVTVHQSPVNGESIEHCAQQSYDYLTKIGSFAPRAAATA